MRARFALAALLLVAPVRAAAEDAKPTAPPPAAQPAERPSTPEQAADAVLAAVRAKADAALQALAAKDDPDPWLVADEILARNEPDAAAAFAKASPRKDVERLPAYVASRRGKPDDVAARASIATANAAFDAGRPGDGLEALRASGATTPGDVVQIRRAFGRGIALRMLGRAEESTAAFLIAADGAERLGWLLRAAAALSQAGSAAYARSDFRGALGAMERLREVARARGDRRGATEALNDIGVMHSSLGEFSRALEVYERARLESEGLEDGAGVARAYENAGNVYASLAEYSTALELQRRALAMKEEMGDLPGAAKSLVNIANVHSALGNFPKALEHMEHARRKLEEARDLSGMATTLNNMGIAFNAMGIYPKALEHLERALTLSDRLGDRAGAAATLSNIGNVHSALGRHSKALGYFERALTLGEAVGDRVGMARTLGSIGNAHAALGNAKGALEHLERALALSEEVGDRATAAGVLGNIGNLHVALGDPRKALEVLERALEQKEEIGDRAGAAESLSSLGVVHGLLGNPARAVELQERSARAAENLRLNALLAFSLSALAVTRLRSGDAGRALESARRGVKLLENLVGGLGDEQGATARERHASLFSVGLLAATALEDAAEAVFFLESGRAGTLLESLGSRQALRWAGLPEHLRSAEAQARAVETRALAAYRSALDAGVWDVVRLRDEELKAAQARVLEVVERIQREAKKEAQLFYPRASPIEDIRGFLAPNEALVLYGLATNVDGLGNRGDAHALVLTRDAARIVDLGKSRELEAACDALVVRDPTSDPAATLDRLRDLLVTPLSLAKETTRLLVSPEGPLSYVPFSALLPGLDVACEASGTTYGVLLDERMKRGDQVLALADPDYGADFDPAAIESYARTRGGRFSPLPATREEAKAVGDVTRLGKDASESGLREALAAKKGRWHAVHFACHGSVDPNRPTLSSLVLTPDADNDGFLTVLEVLRIEIPSDLVVLSACETGKGKVVNGEGIVGLTRAFMHAGAPRVLCSLWKVDDDATRALMTKFYSLWNPKDGRKPMGTAAALRAAQEHVRAQEKWAHPYYWAAWVLWGLPD